MESRDPTTPTYRKHYFVRVMSRLSLVARLPNLKFVSLAILELLAFNTQKFTGSRDPATPTFRKLLSGVMSRLSLETRLPNLKFVSLAVSELLAFKAQKFTGSRDSGHDPFYPIFTFRGWRLLYFLYWFGFLEDAKFSSFRNNLTSSSSVENRYFDIRELCWNKTLRTKDMNKRRNLAIFDES